MKLVIAVGVAALLLIGAVLLLMPSSPRPFSRPLRPAPTKGAPPDVRAPEPDAPSPPPPSPAKALDGRSLLAELARALHNGDDKLAHALLEKLRDYLAPPVPDDQNAAVLYAQAFALMADLIPKGKEREAYFAFLGNKEPSPEELSHLRDWLKKNEDIAEKTMRLLREAADRPQCRFTPEKENVFGVGTTALLRSQWTSNFLSVQASLLRMDGKREEAAETLRAALCMSRAMHSDPSLISQMIGCALDGVSLDAVQREGIVDAPGLATFISGLDPAYVREAANRALLGNVYETVMGFLKWKADPPSVQSEEIREWLQRPLAGQDVAVYVGSIAEVAALSGRPYGETQLELEALARKYGDAASWYSTLSKNTIPSMSGVMRAVAGSEVRLSLLKVASEIESYRARRGGYPDTLDALGASLPRDPFSGQPFAYWREGDGFLLEPAGEVPNKQRLLWRSRR